MKQTVCQVGLWTCVLVVCAGCGSREHLSDDYGRQSRSFFMKQRVNAVATQGSPSGLDSEEAALIQASYTDALGHEKQSPDNDSRVLLLKNSDADSPGQ